MFGIRRGICIPLWVGVLLFLVAPRGYSQDSVRFDRIGYNEGLTKRAIYGIAQDQFGFMWFATEHGLYRFDGNDFTVYTHIPDNRNSISDNLVTSLCADGKGALWIGTETGTVDRLDTETGTIQHFALPIVDENNTVDRSIKSMLFDSSGRLWVITTGGMLLKLVPRASTFERVVSGPSDSIYFQDTRVLNIYEDRAGRFWLSCEGIGIVRADFAKKEYQVAGKGGRSRLNLRDLSDSVVLEDSAGAVWVGTFGHGLYRYDQRRDSFSSVRDLELPPLLAEATHIKNLREDSNRNLWIGTANNGLFKLSLHDHAVGHYQKHPTDVTSLSSNTVSLLYQDRSETLWIGTLEGLCKYSPYKCKFRYFSSPTAGGNPGLTNYIFAIHEDTRGDVWFGMRSGGVQRIEKGGGTSRAYLLESPGSAGTVENEVLTFCEDSAGELYAGTSDLGVFRFDRTRDRFRRISRPEHVSAIYEDKKKVLWIATYAKGIGMLDRSSDSFTYWIPRLKNGARDSFDANVIFEDDRGNLWIGSDGAGLLKLFPDRSTYVHYQGGANGARSLSDDRVLSLAQAPDHSLWIGTRNGLNRMDPDTGAVTQYLDKNILPDTTIYGILIDAGGLLWISTNKGLCRFDPVKNQSRTFDSRDGIIEYEFNLGAYARGRSGRFYFAGGNECIFFKPEEMRDNPYSPHIVITELSKFGQIMQFPQPVNKVEKIVFPWNENTFTIGYSSLDYAENDRNQYAYKLEGFNENWIPAGGRRFANFVHVPPGDYLFQVKGTNNDGLWSTAVASMHIVVVPPFWLTWQFIALMVVLSAAAVIGVYKYRTESIKRQRNALQREVDERRVAELRLLENQRRLRSLASELTLTEERERRKIAQMLHDRIGHALLLAKMKLQTRAEHGTRESRAGFNHEMLDLVDNIIDDAHTLTVEISPPVLYQFGFEAAAENFLESFEQEYNIKTAISISGRSPISDEVAILLYQALRELLVNVVKHAQADMVKISLGNDGKRIKVVITDNGVGMEVGERQSGPDSPKGFGLFSIRERLEPLGGHLQIHSRPGKGTEVIMTAPLRNSGAQV